MRIREHRAALLRGRKRPAVICVAMQQIIGDRLGNPARRLAACGPVEEDRGPPSDLSLKAGKLRANGINRKFRGHRTRSYRGSRIVTIPASPPADLIRIRIRIHSASDRDGIERREADLDR
jgi:hypothetical protein